MVERICSFPGCGRRYHANGYCNGHNSQITRGKGFATPLRPSNIGQPLEVRFAQKVKKTAGCWLWTGATNHLGYGHLWVAEERRVVMAHRVALMLAGRPPGSNQDLDHLCRVPRCVRPDHLEAVTHAENLRRAPYSAVDFQRAKTHCPQGHEYTPENIKPKVNSSGGISRQCRICTNESAARYRARKRAERNSVNT